MCVFVVCVSVSLLFACLTRAESKAKHWTVKYILNISKSPVALAAVHLVVFGSVFDFSVIDCGVCVWSWPLGYKT